jgi:hypothetical protein
MIFIAGLEVGCTLFTVDVFFRSTRRLLPGQTPALKFMAVFFLCLLTKKMC